MNFNKYLEQNIESNEFQASVTKIPSFQAKKTVGLSSNSSQIQKKILSGMEEEINYHLNPDNFQYDVNNLKPENLFEVLELRNDIDILCVKAKNAHIRYDIAKAYEISVKFVVF